MPKIEFKYNHSFHEIPSGDCVKIDGKKLDCVKRVRIDVEAGDASPEVELTLLATPLDFTVDGRLKLVIDLLDDDTVERQATKELYEVLKRRFEGEGMEANGYQNRVD